MAASASLYTRSDASECFFACLESFLGSRWPGQYNINTHNQEVDSSVCSALAEPEINQELWNLYWCDEHFCGNELAGDELGQDPRTDWIINKCRENMNNPQVMDPGPPPADFECYSITDTDRTSDCEVHIYSGPDVDSNGNTVAAATMFSATYFTGRAPTATSASSLLEATVSHNPESQGSSLDSKYNKSGGGASPLSAGVKAAVAFSSGIAALMLLGLGLYLCRRRRTKGSTRDGLSSWSSRGRGTWHRKQPSSSPDSPLISPNTLKEFSSSAFIAPLKPPLRLRDRGFLPSMLQNRARSNSPPLTSLSPPPSPPPGGVGVGGGSSSSTRDSFPDSPVSPLPAAAVAAAAAAAAATPRFYSSSFTYEETPRSFSLPFVPPATIPAASRHRHFSSSSPPSPALNTTTTPCSPLKREIMSSSSSACPAFTPPSSPTQPRDQTQGDEHAFQHFTTAELVSPMSISPVSSHDGARPPVLHGQDTPTQQSEHTVPASPISPLTSPSPRQRFLDDEDNQQQIATAKSSLYSSDAHDIAELAWDRAASQGQQSRGSWGSWSGSPPPPPPPAAAGGGGGVVGGTLRSGMGSKGEILSDEELERLGGKY